MSKVLVDELYKFTEEYRKDSANTSLIRHYIFKPANQKNEEPSGSFDFIDSDKLYDYNDPTSDLNKPDIRTYFKYNSIKGRFLNKHLRVCDLPIGILDKGECPICSLSAKEYDNTISNMSSSIK